VIRLLLEQLAWAHQAYSTDDGALCKLNPTKCMAPFKSVFEHAGKFYGELSDDRTSALSLWSTTLAFTRTGLRWLEDPHRTASKVATT
jgi:hypothetical protein